METPTQSVPTAGPLTISNTGWHLLSPANYVVALAAEDRAVNEAQRRENAKLLAASWNAFKTAEAKLSIPAIQLAQTVDVAGLVEALGGMLDCYLSLVNSGDAGFWNPEFELQVVAARNALSQLPGKAAR